jgi:PAS domain S-box-containing protein
VTLRFLTVNEAAIRRYGYSRDEFQRMSVIDIRPAADQPEVLEEFEHHRDDPSYRRHWPHQTKSGEVFQVLYWGDSVPASFGRSR